MNKRTSFFIKQNFEEVVKDILKEIQNEKQMKEKTKEKFSLFKESKALELQCLGYGLFDQNEALTNYQHFLDQITGQLLKEQGNFSLIVTISGFDFKQAEKNQFLTNLRKKIQALKPKLQGLSIQTSNLQNVTKENFQEFLSLALNTNKQFRKFNLQCSNWNFLDGLRPTYVQVQGLFEKFNKQAQKNPLKITKFRLQLSAWYHKYEQALNFLNVTDKPQNNSLDMSQDKSSITIKQQFDQSKFSSKIQSTFFNGMEKLLRQLFQGLPELEQFELDLRNNHEVLKLKNLKKKLDTMNIKDHVEPTNVVQSSLMSAIFKMNSNNVEKQDQKDKKKAVTINYIV